MQLHICQSELDIRHSTPQNVPHNTSHILRGFSNERQSMMSNTCSKRAHHLDSHCAAKDAPLTRKGATVAREDTATGDNPHRS